MFVSDNFVSRNSTQGMWSIKPDYHLGFVLFCSRRLPVVQKHAAAVCLQ